MAPFTKKALFRGVLDAIRDQKEKLGSTSTAIILHMKSQDNLSLPKSHLRYHVAMSLKDGVDAGVLLQQKSRYKLNISNSLIRLNSKKEKASYSRPKKNASKNVGRTSVKTKGKSKRESPKNDAGKKERRGHKNSLEEKIASPLRIRGKNERPKREAIKQADAGSYREPPTRAPKMRKLELPCTRRTRAMSKFLENVTCQRYADLNDNMSQTTVCSGSQVSMSAEPVYEYTERYAELYDEDVAPEDEEGSEVEGNGEDADDDVQKEEGDEACKEGEKSSEKDISEKMDDDDDFDGADDAIGDEIVEENEDAAEDLNLIPQ